MMSKANVTKHVTIGHENGPRRSLRRPFPLVAGTVPSSSVPKSVPNTANRLKPLRSQGAK